MLLTYRQNKGGNNMPQERKESEVIYNGSSRWKNLDTGDIIEAISNHKSISTSLFNYIISIYYFACSSRWKNLDTGEIIEANDVIKKTSRNGFMITYLTAIIQLIDNLGNRKMQVVKYILENMEKSTNTLIITTTELAKKSKVSRQTVRLNSSHVAISY